MAQYINKAALITEINRLDSLWLTSNDLSGKIFIEGLFSFLDSLEVKEKNSLKGRWVSCKNDLPKRKGVYLVITDGSHNERYDMARYDKEGWHKASKILYWMPIPLKRGIPNVVTW